MCVWISFLQAYNSKSKRAIIMKRHAGIILSILSYYGVVIRVAVVKRALKLKNSIKINECDVTSIGLHGSHFLMYQRECRSACFFFVVVFFFCLDITFILIMCKLETWHIEWSGKKNDLLNNSWEPSCLSYTIITTTWRTCIKRRSSKSDYGLGPHRAEIKQ